MNSIENLQWDSSFFGYPVARVVFDHEGYSQLEKIFNQLRKSNIRVTYFFVPVDDCEFNKQIVKKGGVLVDQKILFSKETAKHFSFSNNITEYNSTLLDRDLVELVLQAGAYSRFRLDEKFTNNEYDRLYTEWLKKSLEKTIALKTFVVLKGTRIVGLTTLGNKEMRAEIGLVAVDEKYRGIGIGSDLIRYTENIAFDLGYKQISIVTQNQNIGACNLYKKCNFSEESIVNIYHYWQ